MKFLQRHTVIASKALAARRSDQCSEKKRDWTLKNGTESWKARLEKSLLEND